ncbi:MarR family transcriptional regulator [Microbacterium betulae]|uniref:MarR family transcriptional regulator n=1 Tax=Microbacterium betulae TaxID=2981139 RepID=A0AA97FDY5_9MICO|nr:MarR family transcriptional regulator [Microbacterium sp. AB]WOF21791.1 MarR family transcriptional regulator [Microbacterium sp. AB]
MDHARDLESIIIAAHALTRVAALETRNEAPAAQWRTLAILRDHGPLRIGELARLSRVTQPGMTRLIGGMERAGLVGREPDPDDSRAVRVLATSRGNDAYAAWRVQLVDALLPRFSDLGTADWDAIRTTAALLDARTNGPDTTHDTRREGSSAR